MLLFRLPCLFLIAIWIVAFLLPILVIRFFIYFKVLPVVLSEGPCAHTHWSPQQRPGEEPLQKRRKTPQPVLNKPWI